MSSNNFKMSSRVLLDILAGNMSLVEFNAKYGFANEANPFARTLDRNRTICGAEVTREEDQDDDWITFHFGSQPDPAIAPFALPAAGPKLD